MRRSTDRTLGALMRRCAYQERAVWQTGKALQASLRSAASIDGLVSLRQHPPGRLSLSPNTGQTKSNYRHPAHRG